MSDKSKIYLWFLTFWAILLYPYLPTPPLGQDMTQGQFLSGVKQVWIQAEELSLPYYLPMAGGRIIGFIPFPRVLVLCEMPSVSSRIWTRVVVSISYDDNHYTTGTSYIYFSLSLSLYLSIYLSNIGQKID